MSGLEPGAVCVCSQLQPCTPRAAPSGTRDGVARWDPRLRDPQAPGGAHRALRRGPGAPFASSGFGSVAALRPCSAGAGDRKRPGPTGLFPGACSAPGGGGGCVWFAAGEANSEPPPRGGGRERPAPGERCRAALSGAALGARAHAPAPPRSALSRSPTLLVRERTLSGALASPVL